MVERIHTQLVGLTSWPRAIFISVVTVILLILYSDYIEPLQAMGGGAVHLDVRFGIGYSLADVKAYFDTLGEEGRAFYAKTTLFDTVWPLCVAASGALWAPLTFRKKMPVLAAAFFPVAFGVLDLFENIGLWLMLAQYPEVSPSLATVSNVFTLSKQAMIPGATIAFFGLPLIALMRKRSETA